jgi:hypothetical protein
VCVCVCVCVCDEVAERGRRKKMKIGSIHTALCVCVRVCVCNLVSKH